jgi:hypothetical protein
LHYSNVGNILHPQRWKEVDMERFQALEWNLQQAKKAFSEEMSESNLASLAKAVKALEEFHKTELKKVLDTQEIVEGLKSSLERISNLVSGRLLMPDEKPKLGKLSDKMPQQLRQVAL